jgi:hypothetical protein
MAQLSRHMDSLQGVGTNPKLGANSYSVQLGDFEGLSIPCTNLEHPGGGPSVSVGKQKSGCGNGCFESECQSVEKIMEIGFVGYNVL